jgi:hypothetical protein
MRGVKNIPGPSRKLMNLMIDYLSLCKALVSIDAIPCSGFQ